MNALFNPELQRHIWLKFSWLRLATMPALLGLIVAATVNMKDAWGGAVAEIGTTVFYICAILWAIYEASTAFHDEARNNTWDFQKMSAISPWQLTVGKLVGATSYAWYFALGGLVLFIAGKVHQGDTAQLQYTVAFMLLAAVMGQAAALLVSALQVSRVSQRGDKTSGGGVAGGILGFVAGFLIAQAVLNIPEAGDARRNIVPGHVSWYGDFYARHPFLLCVTAFFAFWLLAGIYRTVKAELMYKLTPAWWSAFLVSCIALISGFVPPEKIVTTQFMTSFFIVIMLGYAAMIVESGDIARYRRLLLASKQRNRLRALENMPCWGASLVVALFLAAAIVASSLHAPEPGFSTAKTVSLLFSCLLFAARDGIVIHILQLSDRVRHPRFYLLVSLIMAYWVLPLLHFKAEGPAQPFMRALEGKMSLFVWYYPSAHENVMLSLGPVALQIALLSLGVFYYRRKKIRTGGRVR